jgi:ppGpp synthetase/RelA/SpoT-type nucleotidyltranferase
LRLRVETGRIKSANRLLLKAQLPRYRSEITSPGDIFRKVTDIVGTRVTCNTVKDAYAVADEIKLVINSGQPDRTLVKPCEDFEDDYIRQPKDSGYRALSLLVGVPVAIGYHTEPVTSEIQIRTLLQHAWGELTHEDTYKPEMKTPPLIVILSKRLANTLAVLDEIAQDIRDELDKLESEQGAPVGGLEPTTDAELIAAAPQNDTDVEVQHSPPLPVEPAVQVPQGPIQPNASLSPETLRTAFRAAIGRDPELDEKQSAELVQHLADAGVLDVVEIEHALHVMSERVASLKTEYSSSVSLTDYGHLKYTASFLHDPDGTIATIGRVLRRSARMRKQKEEFESAFVTGKEVLGTVVHVASDYALVQLPEGVTGIIHVTAIKKNPTDFLDVHELMTEGQTVRVRIVKSDSATRRIELSLVHQ